MLLNGEEAQMLRDAAEGLEGSFGVQLGMTDGTIGLERAEDGKVVASKSQAGADYREEHESLAKFLGGYGL